MRALRSSMMRAGGAGLLLAFAAAHGVAASLTQQIDPPSVNVGDEVTATITIQNGSASVQLPHVDGLRIVGSNTSTQLMFNNGAFSSASSQAFTIVPEQAGDFTIPAFDVHIGTETLHAHAMKLHVGNANNPADSNNVPAQQPQQQMPGANGPVVMPSPMTNPLQQPGATANGTDPSGINPPMESDGRPAKVFMLITPKTTDAYVGETVPMKIEFFIRMDVLAQQDSLPTIKGSDFLMNDLSVRPGEDELMLANEPFHRETWITAISAPKSGDFPLQMIRDTYWSKNSQNMFADPFANFFGQRPQLAHANIPSNPLVLHVHDLPQEGKPADFSGAIGQFEVSGQASPVTVDVGDPVYLDFNVRGEGNFDSVRCPSLATDLAWKSYVPSSKIDFRDQSRTQGEKTFRQAIIPKKNGVLPLPTANFSYFDPTLKKYETVAIPLPAVRVTGAPLPAAPAPPSTAADSSTGAAMAPAVSADLAPNQLQFGTLRTDLAPAYRQPWFWISQGVLLLVLLLTSLALFARSRHKEDDSTTRNVLRLRSLRELEQAMTDAVAHNDAPAFFMAARRSVQLQWGAMHGLAPEAVTLPLIAEQDPERAEALTALFNTADEVTYSGHAASGLNLADWDKYVREELLALQPA